MLFDYSHFQGLIDWRQADPAIDGAYTKITEGSSIVDALWVANYTAARAAGQPLGAYHFADLGNPSAEANHFADQYLSRKWQLRPVLDIETNGASAAWLMAFRRQFRARTGTQPFRVYSPYSLLTGALNPAGWIDSATDIWAARYRATLGWTHPQLVLWQNSSVAHIPGVLGSVDSDQYQNGWTPAVDTGGAMPALDQAALDSIWNYPISNPNLPGQPPVAAKYLLTWGDQAGWEAAVAAQAVEADLETVIATISTNQSGLLAAIAAEPSATVSQTTLTSAFAAAGLSQALAEQFLAALTAAAQPKGVSTS